MRELTVDSAERMFVPSEMIAIPMLCAISMLVARVAQVYPNVTDDWLVCPNLWGATVARPGMLKSPSLDKALGFLRPLEERAHAEYVAAEAEANADAPVLEAELKEIKRRLSQALKRDQERSPEERRRLDEENAVAAELLNQIDSDALSKLEGPESVESLRQDLAALDRQREEARRTERRYRVTDATTEKLGELLIENPRGLLQVRDELAGFFASLDKPGREADRAFYLESWEGNGDFRVDRISRGSMHVPVMRLAVFGTIQPAKLQHYLGDAFSHGGGDDGLLQRFQLVVWPDELPPYEQRVKPENPRPKQRLARIAEELDRLAQRDEDVAVLHFDPEAQQLQDAFREELETRLRDGSLDPYPAFESYLAKHRSLMPSLALIFHVIERLDAGESLGSICLDCTRRAAAVVEFLEAHARKIYAAELEPDRRAVVALARRFQNGDVEDGITVRDLARNKWKGLTSQGDIWRALQQLEAAGWCRLEEQSASSSRGGRPSTIVRLHPELLA